MDKKKRGGYRPGAGRKPMNRKQARKSITVTLDASILARLDYEAAEREISRSEAVNVALADWLGVQIEPDLAREAEETLRLVQAVTAESSDIDADMLKVALDEGHLT